MFALCFTGHKLLPKPVCCLLLRVLHHTHTLFVEPLLGAHISEMVVANSIKSKLL